MRIENSANIHEPVPQVPLERKYRGLIVDGKLPLKIVRYAERLETGEAEINAYLALVDELINLYTIQINLPGVDEKFIKAMARKYYQSRKGYVRPLGHDASASSDGEMETEMRFWDQEPNGPKRFMRWYTESLQWLLDNGVDAEIAINYLQTPDNTFRYKSPDENLVYRDDRSDPERQFKMEGKKAYRYHFGPSRQLIPLSKLQRTTRALYDRSSGLRPGKKGRVQSKYAKGLIK